MNKKKILSRMPLFFLMIALLVIVFLSIQIKDKESLVSNRPCVPTFADGGGPYYKPNTPFRDKLVPEENSGEKLTVRGKVLLSDCETPVGNAVVDIWQADESGEYKEEYYRGRVRSDDNGNYRFETVLPKGYGEGTGHRPPHIHFKVFVDDREVITSQMFFPETSGRPGFDDAYIMELQTKELFGKRTHKGYHNIILPQF